MKKTQETLKAYALDMQRLHLQLVHARDRRSQARLVLQTSLHCRVALRVRHERFVSWCQRARRLTPCECESESRKSRKIEEPNEKIISSVPTGANEKLRKDPEGQKIQKEKKKEISLKIQRQGQAHGQNTACKAWSKWFLFFLLLRGSHACEYTRMTCTGPPNGPPSSVDRSTCAPRRTLAAGCNGDRMLGG